MADDLLMCEKAEAFDRLNSMAQWVPVGNATGYWQIRVWASGKDVGLTAALKHAFAPSQAPRY